MAGQFFTKAEREQLSTFPPSLSSEEIITFFTLMKDAPYLLDAILDNETELSILEHTTDTAGYTDVMFAMG